MKRKLYPNTITLLSPLTKSKALVKLLFVLLTFLSFSTAKSQTGETLDFDGVNDFVNLPFVVSGSYTKEAWINPTTVSGSPNILSGTGTALFINNGQLAAGHSSTFFSDVINPTPNSLPAGVWTHVAVTYDAATNTMNLYQNGVLVSSNTAASTYTETANWIGQQSFGNYFQGKIDEVRFWTVARTGAQIAANRNCALTGDEPYLKAYYNFQQGIAGGSNPTETTLIDRQDDCPTDNGTLFNFALNGPTSNWVSPGATISSTCGGLFENISLSGNGVCIQTGDVTPSLLDYTDFGDFGYNPLVRTFTIQNTGSATLSVGSVVISGVNASDFTVTSSPAATVAPGGSTTFTVSFSATGAMTARNATITVNNSDVDEPAFTFAVTAFNRGGGETLSFDGIDDSVYLPVRINGSYTKEAWINTNALTGYPNIITGDSTAFFLNNGYLAAGHAPFFNEVIDGSPILANTWVHIAVTYDSATSTMRLYKNGIMVSSNTSVVSRNDRLSLGTFLQSNFYAGLLDEVRIWSIARTGAQIAASMNCGLTGDEFFLQAYYKFNQGAAGGNNQSETILIDSADHCIPMNGVLHNFALNGNVSNWVAPGSPAAGTCLGSFENILIAGNSNCIVSGDNTPSVSDNTDFGNDGGLPIDKTFTINNTGNGTLNISGVTISGLDASMFTVISAPASTVAPGGSTTFTIRFTAGSTGTKSAVVTVTNSDSDEASYVFAISANATVLPVSLLSFDGILKGGIVKLNWKTTAELNNRGFEVWRSNSSQTDWEKIGFVAGSNLSTGSTYALTDYAPLKGINAYKLRQVDIDGRATFSPVVVVNNTDKSTIITAYPNPFQESFSIIFNDTKMLNTVAKIRNATGSTVAVVSLKSLRQQVDLSKLAPGMYFISFDSGEVLRLIKQ